jgi:DNA-binding MarR family transcriptional regulator
MLVGKQLVGGGVTAGCDGEDVARLRIALGRISRPLDRQSRGRELTRTRASVLATVGRCGPLRLSELAETEGLNPTMLSRIVAELEHSGLLHRSPDPDDGRAARVELTTEGNELNRRQRAERTQLLTDRPAALPGSRAAEPLAALPALESLADELADPWVSERVSGPPAPPPATGRASAARGVR